MYVPGRKKIMKIPEVFQFLALVYSNISQMKKLELSITSVSKVIAPRTKRCFCRTAALL
jgi:hypothetical protein